MSNVRMLIATVVFPPALYCGFAARKWNLSRDRDTRVPAVGPGFGSVAGRAAGKVARYAGAGDAVCERLPGGCADHVAA
jgi:hypothetical protein